MGASVILLATALGSGELILWPYITSQVGLALLWLSVVGVTVQWFLNMEIERYTLVTGESAVTGFSRMWLPWGIVMILGAILPNTFPGWAASAGALVTYLLPFGEDAGPIIATIFLFAIAASVTLSPVVYSLLEKVQMVLVGIIVVFVILAIIIATDASAWAGLITEAPKGAANLPRYWQEIGATAILGAVAFAGAGGASNLAQSNWARDKGLGMGIHIPNIVSPITGEEVAVPSLGYVPPDTEENRRRWSTWWKIASQEQLITFWFMGSVLLVALSVLVFSTAGVQENIGTDLAFIQDEARILGERIAPWFAEFFLVAGFVMLFSTNVGIVDYVGRITGDSLKVTFLKESEFWSESKLYITVVWIMAIGGSLLLLTGLEPIVLLVIASTGGYFVMAIYSTLLVLLNNRHLPEFTRLKGWRLPVMIFCAVFYVLPTVYVIYLMVTQGPASVA
jgi:hypothetical protein